MDEIYTVKLSKVIEEFSLEVFYLPNLPENIEISCSGINRPGLQMVGFYDHYEQERVQIIGKVEYLYLATLSDEERYERLDAFFATQPVGVIYTRALI
jgi:HPr kinase/phosphorylase